MPGWILKSTLGCCSSYIFKTVSDKRSSKGNGSMAPTYQLLPEFNLILMAEVEWNELGTKLILNCRAKLLLSGLCKKPKLANPKLECVPNPQGKDRFCYNLFKELFQWFKDHLIWTKPPDYWTMLPKMLYIPLSAQFTCVLKVSLRICQEICYVTLNLKKSYIIHQ
jgi:hypothetical protein